MTFFFLSLFFYFLVLLYSVGIFLLLSSPVTHFNILSIGCNVNSFFSLYFLLTPYVPVKSNRYYRVNNVYDRVFTSYYDLFEKCFVSLEMVTVDAGAAIRCRCYRECGPNKLVSHQSDVNDYRIRFKWKVR